MASQRVNITKDRREISITIKVRTNWFLVFFLLVWLTGWTIGGRALIKGLMTGTGRFLFLWLCAWAVGEVVATVTWLWNVFGREVISVRDHLFIYRREVLGFGWTRSCPVQEVVDVRVTGYPSRSVLGSPYGNPRNGTVAVDTTSGETYFFGINLGEGDALEAAKELAPYLLHEINTPPPAFG
ncbi:MAG TPA: hypothetical protein VE961_26055 [Pyrinomonadaceae bacterium]|nr:hypothetical protein [Pyrinomonadaceae bacterium]